MSKLPSVKPKAVIDALRKAGFDVVRVRGSHYPLLNPTAKRRVAVPHHNRDLVPSARRAADALKSVAALGADVTVLLV